MKVFLYAILLVSFSLKAQTIFNPNKDGGVIEVFGNDAFSLFEVLNTKTVNEPNQLVRFVEFKSSFTGRTIFQIECSESKTTNEFKCQINSFLSYETTYLDDEMGLKMKLNKPYDASRASELFSLESDSVIYRSSDNKLSITQTLGRRIRARHFEINYN